MNKFKLPNLKYIHPITFKKINEMMDKLGANLTHEIEGPNKSIMQYWLVGQQIVIMAIWHDGGYSHYVRGAGSTWDAMETQLHEIAALN